MKIIIFQIILVTILFSCQKKSDSVVEKQSSSFIGNWSGRFLGGEFNLSVNSNESIHITFPFFIKKSENAPPLILSVNVNGKYIEQTSEFKLISDNFTISDASNSLDKFSEDISSTIRKSMNGVHLKGYKLNAGKDSCVLAFNETFIEVRQQ